MQGIVKDASKKDQLSH